MHRILEKRKIAPSVHLIRVEAPLIAKKHKPGQFVILRLKDEGERIPLTVADANLEDGSITIFFQEVGRTTRELGLLNAGDNILDVAGPLGNPSEIRRYGTVVVIGGGVGIAEAYPVAKALSNAGNRVIVIIGARNEDLLLLEEEMKQVADELHVTTDDGSKGHKGFVTDVLKQLIDNGVKIDLVHAIGPTIMMKVVTNATRPYGIKTLVSLNPIMIDGTGMCGGCRVSVGGETKFTCVDGPEFDGHLVDFDLLMSRLRMYEKQEKEVMGTL